MEKRIRLIEKIDNMFSLKNLFHLYNAFLNRINEVIKFCKEFCYSRRNEDSKQEKELTASYNNLKVSKTYDVNRTLIYMADGKIQHGGLADRLRGIVSIYKYCKENNLEFKINFVSPFHLEEYLIPNIYNWLIDQDDIIYNTNVSKVIHIDTRKWPKYLEYKYEINSLKRKIKSNIRQFHIYTNSMFCEKDFGRLFKELFKPSPQLQIALDNVSKYLPAQYISVSTRFLNSLGDFNETCESTPLDKDGQNKLIESCINEIRNIYKENNNIDLLITSDSINFLKEVRKEPYCHIIDGPISHIDNGNHQNEADLKTFMDFFMISKATKSYLLLNRNMHNSNFSKRSAQLDDRDLYVRRLYNKWQV